MRKLIVMMMLLALAVSASVVLADGFTSTPQGNTTETVTLISTADTMRMFNFAVTCDGHARMEQVMVTSDAPQTIYYVGDYADKDQSWGVNIDGDGGKRVGSAEFTYSGGQFTVSFINEGLVFEPSGNGFTLTVTK